MNTDQQIYLLLAVQGWLLLRQYKNAGKLARIETLLKIMAKKLDIES